jgi:hypothetical protein
MMALRASSASAWAVRISALRTSLRFMAICTHSLATPCCALVTFILLAGSAQAETWVNAGVGNVGRPDEATIFVDVDSIARYGDYLRYRALWRYTAPVRTADAPCSGGRCPYDTDGLITHVYAMQEVDCRRYVRFNLGTDGYDNSGRLVRTWRPVVRASSVRPGAPGDVSSQFVCRYIPPLSAADIPAGAA